MDNLKYMGDQNDFKDVLYDLTNGTARTWIGVSNSYSQIQS